ncbi:hypothetical protein MSIBF_A860005 [groundwater metagenome]|uniref:Uncharacterized protein n=1 Tax=groundwater metagenome TaxID=717931 RepID=A0A098EG09_9ZZZZ
MGTDKIRITEEVLKRSDEEFNKFVEEIENPYGDGKTGDRILNKIKNVRNLRL